MKFDNNIKIAIIAFSVFAFGLLLFETIFCF